MAAEEALIRCFWFLTILALWGCGTIGTPVTEPAPIGNVQETNVQEAAPLCRGQKTYKTYASVVDAISKEPTELCVPYFRGFGGFFGFPSAHPPGKLTLMASGEPIHNGLPKLNGNSPLFYLEWYPSWQITLGKVAPAQGVFGKKLIPGHVYTAYGIGLKKGGTDRVGPCYSLAIKGEHGGVFRHLGSLLTGQSDAIFTWTLGIYPGKEAAVRCGSQISIQALQKEHALRHGLATPYEFAVIP